MKNKNPNFEMAELYYNLYVGCIEYKTKKKNKDIDCQHYWNDFLKFTDKYMDSKEAKN
jgi:hypothetical protein